MLIEEFNLDPLITDDNGTTPLHLACGNGHEELAGLLISKYNCPVDIKNFKMQTPVLYTCANSHLNVVWMLVYMHKADLTVSDRVNSGPLHIAALKRQIGIVAALHDH